MAEERVGISAVLKFAGDAAVAGMKKAGAAFKGLTAHAEQVKAGMRDVKMGLSQVGLAHAAVAGATGLAVKKFADFDGQMATVQAVMGETQRKHFPALRAEAEKLGATTSFTAVQAAEAMEELARAGLKPKQVLASVGDVLAGAAADSIPLNTAAKIMVSSFAQFQLKADESARVMDTLAFVSRNTKSNLIALSEGMKFVGLKATSMKIPFEDTIAALGALNDVGLDSTLAGTALKNAMVKMAANAKRGKIGIKGFSFAIEKTKEGNLDLNATMGNAIKKLAGIKDEMKRAQVATQLFGIRGEQAVLAFGAMTEAKADVLFNNLAKQAKGTAKEMQRMQLDSLRGEFTLLSSAVDGVVTAFGAAVSAGLSGGGKSPLATLTSTIGSAASAFQFFAANADQIGSDVPVEIEGVNKSMIAFVRGVLRGIQDVKDVATGLMGTIKRVASVFGFTSAEGSNSFARIATAAAGLSLVMAPLGLAIKGATMLFGPFAKVGVGAFKIVGGAAKGLASGLASIGGGILNKAGLAAKLPGAAKLLGKAAKAAEQATAQSVRVVNWHEAPGGGGTLPGSKPGEGGTVTGLTRARTNLASFMSRFGKTGEFFNSGLKGLTKGSKTLSGKILRLAGAGGAIAAMGAAGFAFGSWLDNKFGISDKLAGSLHRLFNAAELRASELRTKQHAKSTSFANAQRMAQQFARLSQSGVTSIDAGGGKRQKLTRDLAEARISTFLKKQGSGEAEIKDVLKQLNSTLNGVVEMSKNQTINVNVDSAQIAKVTGKQRIEGRERGAKRPTRRLAATGAAP